MKKFLKVIVIIGSILILIAISTIVIHYKLKNYVLKEYEAYNVIIKSIDNGTIIAETPRPTRYIISKEEPLFYDVNENQISVSNINVGDSVYILDELSNKKENVIVRSIGNDDVTTDLTYSIEYTFSAKEEKIWNINRQLTNVSNLKVGDAILVRCKLTNKTEIATIKNIENDFVTVDITCFTKYAFLSENTLKGDYKGSKISISDLKVGDDVYIVEKSINKQNRAIVKSIRNNSFIADFGTKWYSFQVSEDTIIYDSKGNEINISDLKVGDTLKIIRKNGLRNLIADYIESLNGVKLIQLLDDKLYNVSN